MVFFDRQDAGRQLGRELSRLAGRDDVIVLGLPRGGVPVAYEVAEALRAPLDVFVVRKLGVPGQEELAMGALAPGGVRVLNRDVVQLLGIDEGTIDLVTQREQEELARREQLYRGNRPPLTVEGKTVILIDDGLATGSTMRAAAAALRQQKPAKLIVAVPVAARATCRQLATEVDEVVCLQTPEAFYAVGQWYADFGQTSDEEVRELLSRATAPASNR
jgi:predicted phosphoribosyltransferase